jgi:hypothetical protein
MPMPLDTPVLFCNFNRPELTKQVFASIRAQKPKTLFLSCDGPRESRPDDASNVLANTPSRQRSIGRLSNPRN